MQAGVDSAVTTTTDASRPSTTTLLVVKPTNTTSRPYEPPATDPVRPAELTTLTNLNSRATSVGVLCWNLQEVNVALARWMVNPDGRKELDEARSAVETAAAEVATAARQVPAGAEPVASSFFDDLQRASRTLKETESRPTAERFKLVFDTFRFNDYPQQAEFEAVANKGGCVFP